MRRFALLAALLLAGCGSQSTPAPSPKPAPVAVGPAAPVPLAPPPINLPPAPISAPPPPPPDQCGAYLLTGLVGRPRTEIPVPIEPLRRRVICTTCPRTPEIRADRLTIEYDARTGKVTKLGCY